MTPPPPPARPASGPSHFTREETAMREIGHTDFTPGAAGILTVLLLVTLLSAGVIQQLHDISEHRAGRRTSPWSACWEVFGSVPRSVRAFARTPGSLLDRTLAATDVLHGEIRRCETALQEDSAVTRALLPHVQLGLVRVGGVGNEKAYVGRERWLHYRPDVDLLTGRGFLDPRQLRRRAASGDRWTPSPQPDPVQAIVQFRDQLAARGIPLVILPAPAKTVVHPETFAAAYAGRRQPLPNLSLARLRDRLVQAGVLVLDVSGDLTRAKGETGQAQYLETDTHWTPDAVARVAGRLQEFLVQSRVLPPAAPTPFTTSLTAVTNLGDIAVMLNLPPGQKLFPLQSVGVRQILTVAGQPCRPERSADVLLLGDSFANIYSLDGMGWGESAGLAEQLSFELRRPLDVIARNDSGAFATREILSRELAQGRDRLAGKKVVIWEFAMRELAAGDWKLLPMALGHAVPRKFFVPPRGKEITVTGIIEAISAAPRPGTVPYKDHLIAAHLAGVQAAAGASVGNAVVVYLWGMRDGVWTSAARWRPGQSVTLKLRPWSDVSDKLERINRSELADESLQLEEPCWGELVP
jgi:alginate O-acetyltransferase complex protein AlgJ